MIYPVTLETTIAALDAGKTRAPASEIGLQNRTDKPLRVDELRFRPSDDIMAVSGWASASFANFEVQLRVGNDPITAGFVPLPAMTWPVDVDYEQNALVGANFAGFYTRFSKPFVLEPGESIAVQARHSYTDAAQRLVVSAICREAVNGDRYLPWIAAYKPDSHVDGDGDYNDESIDNALANPFDDSIFVERLIGRTMLQIPLYPWIDAERTYAGMRGQMQTLFEDLRVQIEDHNANQIVRDETPFGVVFDLLRKSWIVNAELPARGYYRVRLHSDFTTQRYNLGGEGGAGTFQSFIGMLAYRARR